MSWFKTFGSKQKTQKDEKLASFRKEIVKNAGLHKPLLNKIKTTQE